jgi:hypothetical protein
MLCFNSIIIIYVAVIFSLKCLVMQGFCPYLVYLIYIFILSRSCWAGILVSWAIVSFHDVFNIGQTILETVFQN